MKNFAVPPMEMNQGNDQAPYYNYLKVNQRVDNRISDFAMKMGLFDELLNSYLKSDKKQEVFDVQVGKEVQENNEIQIFDMIDFFTNTTEMDLDNFFPMQQTIPPSKMSLEYRKHILKGYLNNLVKTGFRSFKDVYENKESHKEIFCYSASKHAGRPQEVTKLQTFYFPCGETGGSLVDTQVKYGKQYSYRVQGHYLVVGNKYSYRLIRKNNDPLDPNIEVQVTNEPSIVMMPSNLFMKFINIVKRPPVYPQVSFRTRNNSEKKIYIDLSPTKTELEQDFVSILPSDNQQIEKIK